MAPSDWPATRLGDVAEIAIGGTPSRSRPEFWAKSPEPEGHPWASIADLSVRKVTQTKERITDLGVRHSNVKPVEPGTVLMSFKLTIGRTAFAGVHLYTNEAIAAFRPRPQLDPEFLYHALPLAALSGDADVAIKGMTLNKAKLVDLPLRLPPLAEQRKIAAILSSVDETIEKTEAVIAQLDVVKKAMLEELLTRGIPGRHSRFKKTEIDELPEEWAVVALVDICRPRQWPTISKEQLLPAGFPVFGANGLIGYYSEFNHEHPTIAITCRGATCGTVNVTPPRCYLTGNAMALDEVDEARIAFTFLHQALTHRGLSDSITGSAQPQITRQSLGVVRLPLPSLNEQLEIGEFLGCIDARRAAESTVLRKLREVKAGASGTLLSGDVRVAGDGHA
jgi:type I restriction enzyme, S subunit